MELAELQDQEVGDGTTSVVILAAEFLKRANELVRNKIHPTNIISGFRMAMREVRIMCGVLAFLHASLHAYGISARTSACASHSCSSGSKAVEASQYKAVSQQLA